MPLLRAESGEKEAQVCLEATKDGCTPIAKAVVLSRAPDEALVVDVAGGLNSCDVVKQADNSRFCSSILMLLNQNPEPSKIRFQALALRRLCHGRSVEGFELNRLYGTVM